LEIDIMRKVILAATLAMSPMLLHAQAHSPAKTEAGTLQSSLVQPDDFAADHSAAATPLRVTTGVTAPKLISTAEIFSTDEWYSHSAFSKKVVVEMLVDEKGVPSDLKVVNSIGTEMDKNVLAAVGRYRFKPGTLDNKPVAVPLKLEIVMRGIVD
jgi:TonB family protein